jgi:glucose-1-phosphate adenylyltransferase
VSEVYTLILAGGVGSRLSILTEHRAKPAVPFGGKFRIIDFVLSNCTNSGLSDVGLLTQYRPQSLIEHVGTGRAWDLDRSLGGLHILQPSLEMEAGGWYQGTADAVSRNLFQILRRSAEDVLILSGDHVYAMDYRPFIRFHQERRFPATVAVIEVPPSESRHFGMVRSNASGVIEEFLEKPKETDLHLASMGVYVFRRDVLIKLLQEDQEDPSSSHDFGRDVFPKLIRRDQVGAHLYQGYWQDIGTLQAFYDDNLFLLDSDHRNRLNRPDWPIRTPSVDAPPARVQGESRVEGSMVANGAVIRGTVENSILSPWVVVEPGAVVRHSILMNGVHVRPGASVTRCILDKRVIVGAGASVGVPGDAAPNRKIPDLLRTGLTVLGKDVSVGTGARVGGNICIGGRTTVDDRAELPDGSHLDGIPPLPAAAVKTRS